MKKKIFELMMLDFLEKNELYNQLESQRNTLGEAEERLTRMGKKQFFYFTL